MVAALTFCCFMLSGCLLVPLYDGVRDIGITESDRMKLFQKDAADYGQALGWGDTTAALAFVNDDAKSQLIKDLKDIGEKRRIIETKLGGIDFREDAYKAKVEMALKYYEIPFYTVKTMREDQEWVFGVSDGWKLVTRKIVSDGQS